MSHVERLVCDVWVLLLWWLGGSMSILRGLLIPPQFFKLKVGGLGTVNPLLSPTFSATSLNTPPWDILFHYFQCLSSATSSLFTITHPQIIVVWNRWLLRDMPFGTLSSLDDLPLHLRDTGLHRSRPSMSAGRTCYMLVKFLSILVFLSWLKRPQGRRINSRGSFLGLRGVFLGADVLDCWKVVATESLFWSAIWGLQCAGVDCLFVNHKIWFLAIKNINNRSTN